MSTGEAEKAQAAVGTHALDVRRAAGDACFWTWVFLAARGQARSCSVHVQVDRLWFWSSGNQNFVSLFKVLKWGRNVKIWGTLQGHLF